MRDALAWTAILLVPLWLIPIGIVSGDGIVQSEKFLSGNWRWNPNHLLLEPIGALWMRYFAPIFGGRSNPDVLKLLSITCGVAAIGFYRAFVASELPEWTRAIRNWSTAWFALNAGFLIHLLSDEAHMIQLPMLVLLAAAILRYASRLDGISAFMIGAAGGAAALAYISNLLIPAFAVAALLLNHLGKREARSALQLLVGSGMGITATLIAATVVVWLQTAGDQLSYVAWMLSYSGGGGSARVAEAYGVEASLSSVAAATARALFGSASAIVDQTPLLLSLRGVAEAPFRSIGAATMLMVAIITLGYGQYRGWKERTLQSYPVLMLISTWTVAVLIFAIYWNNSDAQFYFQLAVPVGLLAGMSYHAARGRAVVIAGAAVLLWNVADTVLHQIMYPRVRNVQFLADRIRGSDLIIYPGQDLIDQMLYFVPRTGSQRLSITSLAERNNAEVGLAILDSTIQQVLLIGGTVTAIGIVDINERANPWRFLASLGYDYKAVANTLTFDNDVIMDSSGAFPIAEIRRRR